MKIRTMCITAGAAALALPAIAGTPKQVAGINTATPQAMQPIKAAKYAIIDGQMVLTTPWIYADQGPSTRGITWNYRFDAIEISPADPNGAPDFTDACGLGGGRYLFGAPPTWEYCNPFATNDMSAMGAGAIDGMYLLWYQRAAVPPAPGLPGGEELFIAVQLFDTTITDDCLTPEPVDFVDGVVLGFGVNPLGFWYSAVDLFGLFGISLAAPADGSGSYQLIFGSAFDDVTGDITLSTCVQPGLWGTAAGRVGTQTPVQYDDDFPTDGLHTFPDECYDYTYVPCPDPLCAAIGLMGMDEGGGECDCAGDLDSSGSVDITDLALFLSSFGSTPPAPSVCADIDGSGSVDITDLALFLSAFGSTCP